MHPPTPAEAAQPLITPTPSPLPLPPQPPSPSNPSPTTKPATTRTATTKIPWIPLAAASGACAAFNGVFAKLTTTELTSSFAGSISSALGLSATNRFVEVVIRGLFFLLNLLFNALMWALFTASLTRSSSTTRVSIVNTSANFLCTALAGWMVFGEGLRALWWVGAGGLVVGNVVIGMRERREEEDGHVYSGGRDGGAISDGVELDEAKVKR